ncbi:STAS domain-containing protein [Planctomicrobium sp. SH527]|uniref:STAS domain-containing protein n=1 Tax=Planctomicrobium sp. SH527 TaxID=3448123 RepID=UPI003F5C0E50
MAERKYTHNLTVEDSEHGYVISIGDMEIWDGADLSLIRDTLFRLVLSEGVDSFAIDMHAVQYVPSGFFGMLFDWLDRGVTVRLVRPRPRVQQMLWFRTFFRETGPDVYQLHSGQSSEEETPTPRWSPENRISNHVGADHVSTESGPQISPLQG